MLAKGSGIPMLLSCIPLLVVLPMYYLMDLSLFLVVVFLIPPVFTLYFFRDPDRIINEGVVSPADGRIAHLNKKENKIDIFMNVWDVHVNRAPWDGEIDKIEYEEGGHLPAFIKKADDNERQLLTISSEYGHIKLWQITGCFARRIVPYVEKKDHLKKGEKIGMIRFGSKVRLKFFHDIDFEVEKGEKVKAGETRLGDWSG